MPFDAGRGGGCCFRVVVTRTRLTKPVNERNQGKTIGMRAMKSGMSRTQDGGQVFEPEKRHGTAAGATHLEDTGGSPGGDLAEGAADAAGRPGTGGAGAFRRMCPGRFTRRQDAPSQRPLPDAGRRHRDRQEPAPQRGGRGRSRFPANHRAPLRMSGKSSTTSPPPRIPPRSHPREIPNRA